MKNILIIILILFSIIGFSFLAIRYYSESKKVFKIPTPINTKEDKFHDFLLNKEKREVKLGKDTYTLYVLNKIEDQKIGLSLFEKLDENTGALFIFEKEDRHSIWMKDMKINIDIIFIDKNGRVLEIFENIKKESYVNNQNAEIYSSKLPTKYIIEIGEGRARKSGIKPGDVILLE